ncbi:MAG: mandelate racemase/muconate lactonizing enzyme family protein [SAR324 cluster bacterium]|nr:mandelate racemase/muconate lactonizing enzyme family protein [SAR324 cluster bacterium]
MKITEVQAIHLSVPHKKSGPEVPFVWGRLHQVIVEIKCEDGLVGYGEAFGYGIPHAVTALVNHTLRPLLVGENASDITGMIATLFQKSHIWGRYGATIFAISGVEIALWDLAGKRAGKPLYELLGGAASREVKAYASLVRYQEEDPLIAEHAARAKKEGYEMIKIHQNEVESVALAREAIGRDTPLTVDINCLWTPLEATRRAIAMDDYELTWLEEPVWPPEDYNGLADVQESSGVPLASGENACTAFQFHRMLEAGAVSYVQPSVTKVGGIGEFLKVAALAQTYNVALAPHSPYFGPGFLATLHLIAHTRQAKWIEKIYFDLEADLFASPLEPRNGVYTLPDGPGLGLDINQDTLREFRAEE